MKHVWRPPAFSRNKPGRSAWLPFVCESHLEWLMDMVDREQRGEVLDDEDAEHYAVIREQALTIMEQAEGENWSVNNRRLHMIDAWWRADHAAL